jgi:hypothetical protein
MGMTVTENILAAQAGKTGVEPGELMAAGGLVPYTRRRLLLQDPGAVRRLP